MAKRVLLLGITGVNKKSAMENLRKYRRHRADVSNLVTMDFENRFIGRDLYLYLDEKEKIQRMMWKDAWERCIRFSQSEEMQSKDVILAMHGTPTRPLYDIRSPISISDLKEFGATTIVTLIDDVYAQWYRTERRAGEFKWKGKPTLYQLLAARHAEIYLGDILAHYLASPDRPLQNWVVAAQHPARVLDRLIFGPLRPRTAYLSFPITGPRTRFTKGDAKGVTEVNAFLRYADQIEQQNGSLICFNPLTIDELPLTKKLRDKRERDPIQFRRSDRWDVRNFYTSLPYEPLLSDPENLPEVISIPREDVKNARPTIESDVAVRDYRLVLQARCLAVYNPWFQGERSGGIDNEINCALYYRRPIHVLQEPCHDPNNEARQFLTRLGASALGERESDRYFAFYENIEQFFDGVRRSL